MNPHTGKHSLYVESPKNSNKRDFIPNSWPSTYCVIIDLENGLRIHLSSWYQLFDTFVNFINLGLKNNDVFNVKVTLMKLNLTPNKMMMSLGNPHRLINAQWCICASVNWVMISPASLVFNIGRAFGIYNFSPDELSYQGNLIRCTLLMI